MRLEKSYLVDDVTFMYNDEQEASPAIESSNGRECLANSVQTTSALSPLLASLLIRQNSGQCKLQKCTIQRLLRSVNRCVVIRIGRNDSNAQTIWKRNARVPWSASVLLATRTSQLAVLRPFPWQRCRNALSDFYCWKLIESYRRYNTHATVLLFPLHYIQKQSSELVASVLSCTFSTSINLPTPNISAECWF